MKIVILDSDTVSTGDLSFSGIARYGEVKRYGLTEPERVIERVRDADIILCNKTFITRDGALLDADGPDAGGGTCGGHLAQVYIPEGGSPLLGADGKQHGFPV